MMAFAAGVQIGLGYAKIINGLSKYRPSGFRQNIYRSGKTVIYADGFNSVAKSIRSAFHAETKYHSQEKGLLFWAMLPRREIFTAATHSEIVEIVNNSTFNVVTTCGEKLKKALKSECLREDLEVFI